MTKEQIQSRIYSKDYSYKQFLAAILINSDDTTPEERNLLIEKYGEDLYFGN